MLVRLLKSRALRSHWEDILPWQMMTFFSLTFDARLGLCVVSIA